jgi:indole-3-glycerol phosphate synthase
MIVSEIHDKLKEIYKVKLEEINLIDIDTLPKRNVPISGFKVKFENKNKIGLIAEIKKASPSRGIIRPDFNVAEIAAEYSHIKADAISVLTDEPFFHGHKEYLKSVKSNVSCPVLRKDFIVNEKQVYESYSIGADAILLIVAMLPYEELKHLLYLAYELSLDVLTEAHTAPEIETALKAGASIIGINNRDLNTFKIDLNNALKLADKIPSGIVKVAESGIHSYDDIQKLEQAGYDAVLIGEAFMASDIKTVYKNLFRR